MKYMYYYLERFIESGDVWVPQGRHDLRFSVKVPPHVLILDLLRVNDLNRNLHKQEHFLFYFLFYFKNFVYIRTFNEHVRQATSEVMNILICRNESKSLNFPLMFLILELEAFSAQAVHADKIAVEVILFELIHI